MMKLHVATIALACSLGACQTTTPPDDQNAVSEPPICYEAPPVDCDADLPVNVFWSDKTLPAPLPPPQTDTGVVLIVDNPGDPATQWAFATEAGKITAWLTFPRSQLGTLITQIENPPAAFVAATTRFVAQTAVVKYPVPQPPRLAAWVLQSSAYVSRASGTAAQDTAGCGSVGN
jgi:hypothetical protein